jgi:hypothetical protein
VELSSFLLEDYKVKVEYLNQHFQRMWARFNFMLSIESALVGAVGLSIKANLHPIALAFALIGLAASVFYSLAGLRDRALVERYRSLVRTTGRQLAALFDDEQATQSTKPTLERAIQLGNGYKGEYLFVGDVAGLPGFGITWGPALMALGLVVVWLCGITLIANPDAFEELSRALSQVK